MNKIRLFLMVSICTFASSTTFTYGKDNNLPISMILSLLLDKSIDVTSYPSYTVLPFLSDYLIKDNCDFYTTNTGVIIFCNTLGNGEEGDTVLTTQINLDGEVTSSHEYFSDDPFNGMPECIIPIETQEDYNDYIYPLNDEVSGYSSYLETTFSFNVECLDNSQGSRMFEGFLPRTDIVINDIYTGKVYWRKGIPGGKSCPEIAFNDARPNNAELAYSGGSSPKIWSLQAPVFHLESSWESNADYGVIHHEDYFNENEWVIYTRATNKRLDQTGTWGGADEWRKDWDVSAYYWEKEGSINIDQSTKVLTASSPTEMIFWVAVDDKIYKFPSGYPTKNVYDISSLIPEGGKVEQLIDDGTTLWVTFYTSSPSTGILRLDYKYPGEEFRVFISELPGDLYTSRVSPIAVIGNYIYTWGGRRISKSNADSMWRTFGENSVEEFLFFANEGLYPEIYEKLPIAADNSRMIFSTSKGLIRVFVPYFQKWTAWSWDIK